MIRGDIWWADLGEPIGSEAGFTRPVLIVQEEALNQTRIRTAIAVPLTSNLKHQMIGANVVVPASLSKLSSDSVAQIHLVLAVPLERLTIRVSSLPPHFMRLINAGLAKTLGLLL